MVRSVKEIFMNFHPLKTLSKKQIKHLRLRFFYGKTIQSCGYNPFLILTDFDWFIEIRKSYAY